MNGHSGGWMSKAARSRSRGVRSVRSNTSGRMSGSNRRRPSAIRSFVDEGAHVFISGRRRRAVEYASRWRARNVPGAKADSADLDDLDRLFETVEQEKGTLD